MDVIDLGYQASEILNSKAFKVSFDRLESAIISEIKGCKLDGSDRERLEKLNVMLILSERHKRIFTEMITTGKLSEAELKRRTLLNRAGL